MRSLKPQILNSQISKLSKIYSGLFPKNLNKGIFPANFNKKRHEIP